MAAVVDGTSNTIAVVEAGDESAVVWTKPGDFTPDPDHPFQGLLGQHSVGFLAGMMDGSVRIVSNNLDPVMLMRLLQRSDGNVVDFNAPVSPPRADTSPPGFPPRPVPPREPPRRPPALPEGVPPTDETPPRR